MGLGRRGVAQPCGACDERRTRYVCSRCHKQRYCSRDCQKQDWALHKSTCKASLGQLPSLGLPDGAEPRREEDIKNLYQRNIANLLKATAALREDMGGPEQLPPPRRATAMTAAKDLRKELDKARELAQERPAQHAAQEQKPQVPPRPRNASALLEGQPPVPPRSSAAKELALAAREGLRGKEMSFLSSLVGSDEVRADGGAVVDVRRTEELEKLVSATQMANTRRLAKMRPCLPTGIEEGSGAEARAGVEPEQARAETRVEYESLTALVNSHIVNGLVRVKSDREIEETGYLLAGDEHDREVLARDCPKGEREALAGGASGEEVIAVATQLSLVLSDAPPHEVSASPYEESGEDCIADVGVALEADGREEERKDEEEAGSANTFYGTIPVERLVSAEDYDEDDSETMEEDDIAIIYEMPFFDEELSPLDVVEATLSPELRAPIPDTSATASAVDFYRQQYQQSSSSVLAKSDMQLSSSAFATSVSPRSSGSAPSMANRFNVNVGGDRRSPFESVSKSPSDPMRRTLPDRWAATKEERKSRRRSVLSKFSFSFDGKSKTKKEKSVKKESKRKRKSRAAVPREASQQALPDLAVVAEMPLPEPRAGQPTKRQFSQWLLQFGDQPIQNVMNARHCDWLIGWVKSKTADRRLVHQAAKFLCSLAYPDELVPGLQQLVTRKKAAPALILLAQQGVVAVHREVAKEDVAVFETITRGAEGVIKMAQLSGKAEEKVVVKVCSEENINFDIENFRLEAALMSMLKHEHVCPCFGASFRGPDYFVILPHMARGSLDSVLLDESQELDMLAKVKIATKIAKGMAYIHQGEIMHRDLKSANVLLGNHMEVKIIDFGTSVVLLKRGQSLQRNMGTTAWIAPEVFVSSQYSKSADVYSFGIVLWEIVMRRCQPYEGVCKIFDLPTAVPAGMRPPLPEPGACPDAITALMQHCWHANPSARPSFTEVTRRLYDVYKTLFIARGNGDSAPFG